MRSLDTRYTIDRRHGCVALLRSCPREVIAPDASQGLYNHSPDGFEFGYGGSGPAQLALAILFDFTEDADRALCHYQPFKWHFVAKWHGDAAEISGAQIAEFLAVEEANDAAFDALRGKEVR